LYNQNQEVLGQYEQVKRENITMREDIALGKQQVQGLELRLEQVMKANEGLRQCAEELKKK